MNEINERRSIRKYKDKSVEKALICELIEAAKAAPSAKNRQPWKFIVFENEPRRELLDRMESGVEASKTALAGTPDAGGIPDAENTLRIMRQAPVIIAVINTNAGAPFDEISGYAHFGEICDTLSIGAAIENMLLRAQQLGLGTLWIANTCYAYDEMSSFIGEQGQLVCAVAVGYPDEKPSQRPRKPFENICEFRN